MQAANTNNYIGPPSPERLLKAADAILRAETPTGKGTVTMWRDDTRPARVGFSSHELVEAMMFLRRLGLVESDSHNRA
jgi:hypothetical protein